MNELLCFVAAVVVAVFAWRRFVAWTHVRRGWKLPLARLGALPVTLGAWLLVFGLLLAVFAPSAQPTADATATAAAPVANEAKPKPAGPAKPLTPAEAAARIQALDGDIASAEVNTFRTPPLVEVTIKPSPALTDRQVFAFFALTAHDVLKAAVEQHLVPAGHGLSFTMEAQMVDQFGNSETSKVMTIELSPDVIGRINFKDGHFYAPNLLNVSHLAFLRHSVGKEAMAYCTGSDADDVVPFCRQAVAYLER